MTALRGDNDILEDKFQTLVNINAGSLGVQVQIMSSFSIVGWFLALTIRSNQLKLQNKYSFVQEMGLRMTS